MIGNYLLWILLVFPPASIAQDAAQADQDGKLIDSTIFQDFETNQFVNITSTNDSIISILTSNNKSVITNINTVPILNTQFINSNIRDNLSTVVYNDTDRTTESAFNHSHRKNDSITLIQIEIIDENVNISSVNIFNLNSSVINNGDKKERTEPLGDFNEQSEKYQVESINQNTGVTTEYPKEMNKNDFVIVTPSTDSRENKEDTTQLNVEDEQEDKEWSDEVTQFDDEYKTTIIFSNLYSPGDEVTQIPDEINLDTPRKQEEKEADKISSSSDQKETQQEEDTKRQQTRVKPDEKDNEDNSNEQLEETTNENSDIDKDLIRISEENAFKLERARNQLINKGQSQLVINDNEGNLNVDHSNDNFRAVTEHGFTASLMIRNQHEEPTSQGPEFVPDDASSRLIKNTDNEPIDTGINEQMSTFDETPEEEQNSETGVSANIENSTVEKLKGTLEDSSNVFQSPSSTVPPKVPQRKDIRALIEEKRRTTSRRIPSFRLNQTRYRDQPKAVNKVIQKLIANRDPVDSTGSKGRTEDVDAYAMETNVRKSWGGCARECGEATMTCRYELTLEWFHTMSKACYSCPSNLTDCFRPHCIPADGVKRTIAVINRSLPGPLIQVCEGDTIVAKVTNHLIDATTTIHWHGQHQLLSPYMDGVPSVTQCPIQPGASFTYSFTATQPGTHFYHSHSGVQRGDGAFGGLIVRRIKSKERHRWTYDRDLPEHTISILDWTHHLGLQTFTYHHLAGGGNKPDTILVNGRGIVGNPDLPPASFTVTKGLRYRFRLINAGVLNCPIRISIDDHRLTIIASDGNDIQPYIVDWLVTYAGERWDFVVEAKADVANYWMRFIGLMDCDERFTSAHQGAVLHYSGATLARPPGVLAYNSSSMSPRLERPPKILNQLNAGLSDGTTLVHQLNGLARPQPWLATREPDRKIVLAYDFNPLDNAYFHKPTMYGFSQVIDLRNKIYTPQLNHISLRLPPFPLLTQSYMLTPDMLCSKMNQEVCKANYCECTNIIDISLGDVVEVIFIDQGFVYDANHPFHLHGHSFYVVGMDRLGSNVTSEKVLELDSLGQIHRNLGTPPLKDTVTVPDGGYTIIRFRADNPGYWMLHCHIDFHVEVGMAVVLRVGQQKDVPPPPIGFPTCGDFEPTLVDVNTSGEEVAKVQEQDNRIESSMVRLIDPTVSPGFGSRWKYNTSSSYSVTTPSRLYTAVCLLVILLAST